MNTEHYPEITDELLSAYLDGEVDAGEQRLVEQAVSDNPDVAWRLESLRATVQLLHELPALALPRAFVLSPEQAGQRAGEPVTVVQSPVPLSQPTATPPRPRRTGEAGWWARWRGAWQEFWRAGNPALRNAMAASFAAFLFLLVAPALLAPRPGIMEQESVALQDLNLSNGPGARQPAPPVAAPQAASQAPAISSDEPAAAAVVLAEVPDRRSAYTTSLQYQAAAAPDQGMSTSPRASAMTAASVVAPASALAGPAPDALSAAAAAGPVQAETMAAAPAAAPAEANMTAAQTSSVESVAKAAPAASDGVESAPVDLLAAGGSGQPDAELVRGSAPVSPAQTMPASEEQGSQSVLPASAPATILSLTEPAPMTTAAAPARAPLPLGVATLARTENGSARVRISILWPAYPSPAPPVSGDGWQPLWLLIAQAAAGAGAMLFGLLWWRTRRA